MYTLLFWRHFYRNSFLCKHILFSFLNSWSTILKKSITHARLLSDTSSGILSAPHDTFIDIKDLRNRKRMAGQIENSVLISRSWT